MTPDEIPSAAAVRREVAVVVAAYAIPPLATGALLILAAISGNPLPFALLVAFLALGTLEPTARHVYQRLRDWRLARRRGKRRGHVDDETRAAILKIAPELAGLTMVVTGNRPRINGSRLLVGATWMGPERPGTPASDTRFFEIAHEARHHAVRAFGLLRWFRLIRAAQMAAAGSIYTAVLANVAAAADDPYRVALTIVAVLLPYFVGSLRAVLDEASNALEWRLELDAEAAAVSRCLLAGRPGGITPAKQVMALLHRADVHGPMALRIRVLAGASVRRSVVTVLAVGWLAMIVPFVVIAVVALTTTDTPDLANELSGIVLVASVALAAGSVVAAAQPSVAGSVKDLTAGACILWMRIHAAATRLLGGAMSILAGMSVWGLCAMWLRGSAPRLWDVAACVVCLAVAATYIQVGWGCFRPRWLAANAVADAVRVWLLVWLLRASGVLPFFDDLQALGSALRDNPGIIWNEMDRMWQSEGWWIAVAALGSAVGSGLAAFLAVRATTVLGVGNRSIGR